MIISYLKRALSPVGSLSGWRGRGVRLRGASLTSCLLPLILLPSCHDYEELNHDPSNPTDVPPALILSGVEKQVFDNFTRFYESCVDLAVAPQYLAERIYTESCRYLNSGQYNTKLFDTLYLCMEDIARIERLAENDNQRAVARIFRAWLMANITDIWGDVPYTEMAQLTTGKYTPAYDHQKDIYAGLIRDLTEAQAMIDEKLPAFPAGADQIYGGDAGKWRRFANTLRCRLAVHLSKVDPQWKAYIAAAVADGVFTGIEDNASYHFSTAGTEYCGFYEDFYIYNRNDLSISREFTDLLTGQEDVANGKHHPWKGVTDPRLPIFTPTATDGSYTGVPYGLTNSQVALVVQGTCNWKANPPYALQRDFAVPILSYAELMYILCEAHDYDEDYYRAGLSASIRHWAIASMTPVDPDEAQAYIDAVTTDIFASGDKARMAEAVAVQKYIDLFLCPTEGWTELRRTGYPEQLLRPGEVAAIIDGEEARFVPFNETHGFIRRRCQYPVVESTLNRDNFNAAVERLQDGTNNIYSPMYWDVRTSPYDHPKNQ